MRLRKRFITLALVAFGGLMAAAPGAFGAANQNPNASCLGSGSSSLAPGQALNAFAAPGARAEIAQFGVEQAALLGTSPGQLVKPFAQQSGTAPVCFPAGPPGL